ncbi:mediator of RNA polymerase II transcription subunit 13 isoform X4 [Vespula pensylvanica]|uniref:mediator of RNA polymerase II transcription subunit 13 isoform X4 n=1 Tax=Vespula pensylvanica TaxID=30213 RepID=UPI001CBA4B47|nr:mediator of RNA polymerase II transcription subunit 13 isoform X4 [Vespula pensylvanica]
MTHPSHQTNGASLEDCHTNFFALTDLCGIKWRKLVWGEVAGGFGGTPLEDPVLSSFSRCLAGDILCVWRRVAATPAASAGGPATASGPGPGIFELGIAPSPAPPPLSLTAAKELWIFWYGEEPDLSGLVSPELIACESEQGSWESGLSYECRSLLFKALHNLIERCLLSRDFVRLGKWFVQPYDGFEKHRCSSSHLSFSFAFFVHGESTVCASVDVRQHPAVRHLTRACLQRTQTSQSGVKVILAPYGLAGTLTGQVGRMDSQLLEEWKHFYPINSNNIETGLPPLVEVLVGGVRMRYPSCYVLVTDMDDTPPGAPLSPPNSPISCENTFATEQDFGAATELPERVWAECTLSSPVSASKTESSTELGTWTFVEPTQKASCTCSKSVLSRVEAPSTPPEGPPSYSRGPPTGGDCLPVPSVGSPGSPAPSPLPTPHSEPASVPPAEPTMPTLSPQPPPSHTNTAPPLTPSQGPKSASSACNNQAHSPLPGQTLKRPILASREYEGALLEDEQPLSWLYDYSTQEAWLNHPVKRFKGPTSGPTNVRSNTLYPPMNLQALQPQAPKLEIKQEPNVTTSDCIGRRSDPYEFDAMGEENNTNVDGLRRQRDDPPKPGSLFTSEGLQASYKDLEQIFDNSDPDTSSDETNLNQLQVQTPPGSNKSGGMHEETRIDGTNKHNNRGVGVLRPEELSKMFPTPPSLEHNPVASPCQLNDPLTDQTDLSVPQRPLRHLPDIYPNMGSPQEEPIDDWSYVFKPAPICKMVGSSKYAPLTNLPSQSLPPVTLPSHCVYRPSWQCSSTSINSDKPLPPSRPGSVQQQPCPPSPAPLGAPYRTTTLPGRPPPPPYDQPSPATSTTSSYLNKNLNSIEADTPGPTRAPESNSLVVNILLGDTALNIFRDHNFDSCSLCVCNAGPKVVGNIKGADAGVYLTNSWGNGSALIQDDDQIRCSCGFSAVVNRRLAHKAGLFYEDEMEITGIAEDPAEKKKGSLAALACGGGKSPEGLDIIPPNVLELLREQCLLVQSSASSLYRAARIYASMKSYPMLAPTVNTLEFNDGNEVSLAALDQGKIDSTHSERTNRVNGIHRWVFLRARGPQCSGDIVRMMRALQPLLQDAVQKKCTTRMWEAPYTVAGPLTWRQFHRLAGRGTDDRCEPQPIPALVVGYDRDWLSLSPYALGYWEKLLLEPYAGPRDIAYVVVAPDSDCVVNKVKSFFRELSTTYEICRLGRHTPISKVLRDGILRVGKSAAQKLAKQPIDEWFKFLGENRIGELLRLYAQVCNHRLAPYLTQVIQDRSLLDPGDAQLSNKQQQQQQQQQPQTTAPVTDTMPATPDVMTTKPESVESENPRSETPSNTSNPNPNIGNTTPTSQMSTGNSTTTIGPDEEEVEPPAVVVYLVEPFSLGGPEDSDRRRLAILALLRAYSAAVNSMPENIRSNINVQLISLESIMELGRARERRKIQDEMRALALNVFLQGRRLLNHNSTVKSLTGFGTAAAADLFLKSKDSYSNTLATPPHQERNKAPYRLYAPAYVLAPLRAKSEAPESFGIAGPEECAVLYLSYCLSEDQSWLLAVATDDRGEIFETATINIDIPNRKRRKRASARRIGLQKLMDFILGVMSQGVQPWRLVVGRVGRIGHGELKGWSWLLSRKALLKASKHLKEICGQCSLLYPSAAPCVLSACLVSLEPDSTLRLMADQFTPDERFSQASVNCQLSTPQDVTCTHILVFPTSATTQSSQTAFQEQHINGPELGDDELFSALNDDMPEAMEGMGDFNDIFNVWPEAGAGGGQSPSGSPHRPEGSPLGGDGGGSGLGNHDGPGSPFQCSNTSRVAVAEQSEEVGTLLQQPLALGYLVSTAPTGRMPPWFWAACPHLEGVCPVFLKNALHLHSPSIQQNSDDLLQQQSALTAHPLDSQYTTDVLRYVLEGYNALSWLAMDANTKDRLSCLPVHVQALMQLYHAAAALV